MKHNIVNQSLSVAAVAIFLGLGLVASALANQNEVDQPKKKPQADSDEAIIQTLLSAGPESVTKHATVLSRAGKVLQQGNGEWVCRFAGLTGDTPTCLDSQSRAYFKARFQGKTPQVERIGLTYMLHGMTTDTGMQMPPHVMVIVPDPTDLKQFPTTPQSGAPWVMKANTPYAHLIIPVGGQSMGAITQPSGQ
jgi:hypothetical protein